MRLRLAVSLLLPLVALACGGSSSTGTQAPIIAHVVVTAPATLNVGQTATARATPTDGANAAITSGVTVVWSSSTTTVATIDQAGTITAVGAGTTTITADISGVKGTASVKVNLVPGA